MRLPAIIPGIQTREVLRESFMVALPDDHPLASSATLQPAALARLPVLILARRYAPGFHDQLMQELNRQGAQLEVAAELGEFTTMLALVSAGLGIGLLPTHAGRALPANVVARPLELGDYQATTGLAWVELDNALKSTVFGVISDVFLEGHGQ